MYYECRKCEHEEIRGCLPGVTCGIVVVVWGSVSMAAGLHLIDFLFPQGLGWWWIPAGPALFFFSIIPGAMILHLIAETIEWGLVSLRGCRKCRSHRLSFGRTHGFGL